jgi:hypothetical protein
MNGARVKTTICTLKEECDDGNAQSRSENLELMNSCREKCNDSNTWGVIEDLEHPHEKARTICFFLQFRLTAEGLHPTGRISLVKLWGEENRVQLPTAPSHGCGWKEWITPPTK